MLVGTADEVELGMLDSFCTRAAAAPQMSDAETEAADAETLANAEAYEGRGSTGGRVVF